MYEALRGNTESILIWAI